MASTTFSSQFPFDLASLWDSSANPLDYAQSAYKAWVDASAEMQNHSVEFLNSRLATDSAAIAKFVQCRTPLEILGVQADYARQVFAELVAETQKIAAWSEAHRKACWPGT
jgi:hypothetical protein